MKNILCLLAIALPLAAATETATVTVRDADSAQFAAIVESWIQGQVNPDGSLKYDGATQGARRQVLFDAILRNGMRRVVEQACIQFPADCTRGIKVARSAEAGGKADAATALEALIR
jgi:hypothetical protein